MIEPDPLDPLFMLACLVAAGICLTVSIMLILKVFENFR